MIAKPIAAQSASVLARVHTEERPYHVGRPCVQLKVVRWPGNEASSMDLRLRDRRVG